MTSITWQIARASGIVAWALITAAVIWGLLLSTRLLGGRPTPRWIADLHRFLGGLSVIFVATHLIGLAFDGYLHFGPVQLLVPFTSTWKPTEVALGITAGYLLVAVELTSLARHRISRQAWKAVHLTSYALFWLVTVHGLTAGTDTRNPLLWAAYAAAAASVLFLTLTRILVTGTAHRPNRTQQTSSKLPANRQMSFEAHASNQQDVRAGQTAPSATPAHLSREPVTS